MQTQKARPKAGPFSLRLLRRGRALVDNLDRNVDVVAELARHVLAEPSRDAGRQGRQDDLVDLAAAHGVQVSPHVVHEISLHIVGTLANGFLVEFMDWAPPDLFEELPQCKGGRFRISDRPGHGMALAPGALEKYRRR